MGSLACSLLDVKPTQPPRSWVACVDRLLPRTRLSGRQSRPNILLFLKRGVTLRGGRREWPERDLGLISLYHLQRSYPEVSGASPVVLISTRGIRSTAGPVLQTLALVSDKLFGKVVLVAVGVLQGDLGGVRKNFELG